MSFFFSRFSGCKIPLRKKISFHSEPVRNAENNDQIRIELGAEKYLFTKGEWVLASSPDKQFQDKCDVLEQQLLDLEEEKHLFQLKTDLLLDMLTNVTSENQMKEKEINRLRLELFSSSRN